MPEVTWIRDQNRQVEEGKQKYREARKNLVRKREQALQSYDLCDGHTKMYWYAHHNLNTPLRVFNWVFESGIPPGKTTGLHTHTAEAVIYILEGKGYSIVDGERYDWEEGDIVCVPSGTAHRHCNASETRPVRYLGIQATQFYNFLGLGEVKTLEAAPGLEEAFKASQEAAAAKR